MLFLLVFASLQHPWQVLHVLSGRQLSFVSNQHGGRRQPNAQGPNPARLECGEHKGLIELHSLPACSLLRWLGTHRRGAGWLAGTRRPAGLSHTSSSRSCCLCFPNSTQEYQEALEYDAWGQVRRTRKPACWRPNVCHTLTVCDNHAHRLRRPSSATTGCRWPPRWRATRTNWPCRRTAGQPSHSSQRR